MSKKVKEKMRVDLLLLERGLVSTLDLAKTYILAGRVIANDNRILNSSELLDINADIRLKLPSQHVGRGYKKLLGALLKLDLVTMFKNAIVLDIGASTGGFTQCCLDLGAKQVVAVDVGTNQLAWKLRQDPKVVCLEKTNIIDFNPNNIAPDWTPDWILADISFNSLVILLPSIIKPSRGKATHFLVLVKPQFELKKADIPAGGVVNDPEKRNQATILVKEAFNKFGFFDLQEIAADLPGKEGNQETFLYVK